MSSSIESLKIVLLGEPGVGKTCIITQFVEEFFQSDTQSSSTGTFSSRTCIYGNNKFLKLDIWDTAGQEQYRSLTKLFYKDANVAILVYDITSKQSFDELKGYWANQVKESGPTDILLVICANKSDLINIEQVDEEEARNYAKEIGALFCLTSAKSADGISDLFLQIAQKHLGIDDVKLLKNNEDIPLNKNDEQVEKDKKKGGVTLTNIQQKKKKKFC